MEQTTRAQSSPSSSSSSPRHAPRRRRGAAADAHPAAPPGRRIVVSGYPNYTQPQDLLDAFEKFGSVRIDRCTCRCATLTFGSEQEAQAALAARRQLHVYGYAVCVAPYSARVAAEAAQPTTPKREFPMSKKKGVIVEPKKIDLSGDFHCQLDSILSAVRLTQEDVKNLSQLYTDLEIALQAQWPGCKAVPFGSITTGLGIKTSDADCFINIPGQYRQPNGNYVNQAKRVLMQYSSAFAEILAIPRANTPIVKFFHIPTETNCDVTFKTPLGAQNSRLVAFLLQSDPRLLPMAVVVKYWAKVHELSGTGKLTNYALTLMLLFYLQQAPHCILPGVAWLQRDAAHAYLVDHWDTGFMHDPSLLPPCSNTSSISELLGGFFEYYSLFNFDEMVICPYLGVPVKRELFRETAKLPDEFERYKKNVLNHYVMPLRYQSPIVVQDPFEQCHNVASSISSKLAVDIISYFKFCANAYEKEKLNGCQDFLSMILLQKPKLLRGKTHPEFRVNLFPRIVNPIISFDWKSVVRHAVMEIFENMLKIKVGKMEEKVNPDSRKEKEKYSGTLTKPIWKRKVFNKLYSVIDLCFEEKQGKITQEIMKAEKQEINVQFQLTLTYCHDPKSAVIAIKLNKGDLEAFREFGKFFISVTQNWLTELLKPFSMPNCKDTATKIAETMENNDNEMDSDDDDDSEIILLPKSEQAAETSAQNNVDHTPPSTEHTPPSTEHTPPSTEHTPPSTEHTPPSTEHTPRHNTHDTPAHSLQQTLNSASIESLTKEADEILTITQENLNNTIVMTQRTDGTLVNAHILTNNTDESLTIKSVVLTNNTGETSS